MPFKSKAQMAKFAEMVKAGIMKQSVFDEWNKDTDHKKLPERITPKKDSVEGNRDVRIK